MNLAETHKKQSIVAKVKGALLAWEVGGGGCSKTTRAVSRVGRQIFLALK